MSKRLFPVLALFLLLIPAVRADIQEEPFHLNRFHEIIDIQPSGAALVTWHLQLDDYSRDVLDLPFSYVWGENIQATFDGSKVSKAELVIREGVDFLRL